MKFDAWFDLVLWGILLGTALIYATQGKFFEALVLMAFLTTLSKINIIYKRGKK